MSKDLKELLMITIVAVLFGYVSFCLVRCSKYITESKLKRYEMELQHQGKVND